MQPENHSLGTLSHQEISRLAQTLQLRRSHVEEAIKLLDEGLPPSFIARYRRSQTAGMPEPSLRAINEKIQKARQFMERKSFIIKSLESQGKLTDEIKSEIQNLDSPRALEDLFLPFRPRKTPFSADARAKGLENFATAIWTADPVVGNPTEFALAMVNPEKKLENTDQVLEGMTRILADYLSENAKVRGVVREILFDTGKLVSSRSAKHPEKTSTEFREFFSFSEPLKELHPRKFLSIERGVKAGVLNIHLDWDKEKAKKESLLALLPTPAPTNEPGESATVNPIPLEPSHPHLEWVNKALHLSIEQVLGSSLERECLRDLAEKAAEHVGHILARCLHNRLMAAGSPPIKLLAIDPGFRTGCKIAVLDVAGKVLDHAVVFPHQPQGKKALALLRLEELIRKHQVQGIALGNGNACKATELLIAELIERLENPKKAEELTAELAPPTPVPLENPASETEIAPSPVAEIITPPVAEIATGPIVDSPVPTESTPSIAITESGTNPEVAGTVPQETPAENPSADSAQLAQASKEAEEEKKKKEIEEQRRKEKERRQAEYLEQIKAVQTALAELPPAPLGVVFTMVMEAGASEYGGSQLGKEEHPELDPSIRAAVSIGRRVLNPLRELTKIDPVHLVSGMVSVDLPQKSIRTALEGMVESCINCDGLDLAIAERHLLRHVPGLNTLLAQNICSHRDKIGGFKSRKQLLEVDQMTPQKFELAAGFLYLIGEEEPFDATNLHPECYEIAEKILAAYGLTKAEWNGPRGKEELLHRARNANMGEIVEKTGVGSIPALRDFLDELTNPLAGLKAKHFGPIFRSRVLTLEDLNPGMELQGVIQNVVEFGCFVDVGLKESGLVHISQISAKYVRSPFESVSVGDVIRVWVMSVDKEKQRVSLTMIRPGSEGPPHRRESGRGRGERTQPQGEPQRERTQERAQPPESAARPFRPAAPQEKPPPKPLRSTSRFRDERTGGARPQKGNQPNEQPQVRTFHSKKPVSKPILSQSALSGSSPLGTFAELAVFWEKKAEDKEETPEGIKQEETSIIQNEPKVVEGSDQGDPPQAVPPTD